MPQVQPAAANANVYSAVQQAARATGTDFEFLLAQAGVESAYDPSARAGTSSAAGLFQFIEQTWLRTIDRHGARHGLDWAADAIDTSSGRARIADPALRERVLALRYDPQIASVMAGELARDNAGHIETAVGRLPDQVELYLAHFLGAGAAVRFIRSHDAAPGQSAAGLFPAAASANRQVFHENGRALSLAELRERISDRLASAGAEAGLAGSQRAFADGGFATSGLAGRWPSWPEHEPTPPDRVSMTERLAATFGSAATDASTGGQVARAYARFARFGL